MGAGVTVPGMLPLAIIAYAALWVVVVWKVAKWAWRRRRG
jgi:hypothetical protein